MIGKVDDRNRALVDLQVRQTPNSPGTSVTAWIDTAFDGHLVFPASLIKELKLESLAYRARVTGQTAPNKDADRKMDDRKIIDAAIFLSIRWSGAHGCATRGRQ